MCRHKLGLRFLGKDRFLSCEPTRRPGFWAVRPGFCKAWQSWVASPPCRAPSGGRCHPGLLTRRLSFTPASPTPHLLPFLLA